MASWSPPQCLSHPSRPLSLSKGKGFDLNHTPAQRVNGSIRRQLGPQNRTPQREIVPSSTQDKEGGKAMGRIYLVKTGVPLGRMRRLRGVLARLCRSWERRGSQEGKAEGRRGGAERETERKTKASGPCVTQRERDNYNTDDCMKRFARHKLCRRT